MVSGWLAGWAAGQDKVMDELTRMVLIIHAIGSSVDQSINQSSIYNFIAWRRTQVDNCSGESNWKDKSKDTSSFLGSCKYIIDAMAADSTVFLASPDLKLYFLQVLI